MDSVSGGVDGQQSHPPSSSSSSVGANMQETTRPHTKAATPNFIGKHRMSAAISHLHQQIQIIQEELDQLETLGESSIVCKELISSVESVPDALLPVTKGPEGVGWDRWFQGAHGTRSRKRWI
ncbi:hypothetical protein F0562_035552 [Nyssa sinensis]|uniref:G protein gamma domain-containing protein n=1 Tax=Nyssa sinensis TaxID=561372 RepID=A0A5J5AFG7_9ASTE|nr:hypothetical protein F0562_035552 [Nyssa sinensis]